MKNKLSFFSLLILLLLSGRIESKTCENSLSELFKTYQGDQSKIDEFLKIQAGITMHKLAYATLRNSNSKEQYRIENEILKLLDKQKKKYVNDQEFKKVYELYNHPDNKLSRTSLSRVLPYLKDIINEQNSEQSAFRRKYFNVGLSDVRILAILAEKESQRSGGVFDHRQFRDHDHENSILNFTKIINSSVRNTNWDENNILKNFNKRIATLHQQAIDILTDIGMPEECKQKFNSCQSHESNNIALDESFLSTIGGALEKLEGKDLTSSLRYDDVWLHTKTGIHGTKKGNTRNKVQHKNKDRSPNYIPTSPKEVVIKGESSKEVVVNYLVAHVLEHVPHLFTKEELLNKPEFTVALSQAIDKGILTKKSEKRSFFYNGKKYTLPELWNGEYSDLGMGRPAKGITSFFSRTFRIDEYDEDDIDIPKEIPDSLHGDFMTTMNDQWENFGHKYAFSFNGALYSYPKGKKISKGMDNFLKTYQTNTSDDNVIPKSESPLNSSQLDQMAKEIKDGNRSFVDKKNVYHISGAPAILKKEYSRAKVTYEANNIQVNDKIDEVDFPRESEIVKLNLKFPVQTLKTLTDRKRSFHSNNKSYDLYTGREVDRSTAINILVKDRQTQGFDVEGSDYFHEKTEDLITDAHQLLNNKKIINEDITGMVDADKILAEEVRINKLSNSDTILEYYSQNPHPSCEYISIVDKNDSNLSVYKFDGSKKIVVFKSPIEIGKEFGDERTLYRDSTFKNTNNKTGAGEYTFGQGTKGRITLEHPFQEGPSQVVPMGIDKSEKSSAEVLLNPRTSSGSILIPEPQKSYYAKTYITESCPLIVLPETDKLKYQVIENDLQLVAGKNYDKNQSRRDFHFELFQSYKPRKIEITLNDPRYLNANTEKFLDTLESEKRQIMEDLNLTNNEYNQLAKLSFGIMGTESSFGEGDSNLFGLWNSYKYKESGLGQLGVSLLKGELKVIPLYPGTIIPIQTNPGNNSRGVTQIKNVREFLSKSYPDINMNNLSEPRNSAIATMYALKAKLDLLKDIESNHSAINDENRIEYLYYMYLGSTNQIENSSATPSLNPKVREANGYAKALNIYTE